MIQKIRDIYNHLGDDESKEIYGNRLLFSLTGDRKYMECIIKSTALYQEVCEILENDKADKYIAGAGQWGKIIVDLFWEFGFSGIIDNYVTGSYRDIPIVSMNEFLNNASDTTVYVASTRFHEEFCQMLENVGIRKERVVDVAGMMLEVYHNRQYFDLPCLLEQREKHEVFIDGGCYDGANTRMFVNWVGNAEKTVYAFEPDENNIKECAAVLEKIEGLSYQLIPKGLWNSNTLLGFCARADEASRFVENGQANIPVTSLDTTVDGKVTFIKLDIEGAEYEALRGAERLIRQYKPKLAISIYHKLEDIWELPQLILSFCSDYIFYLRHYSLSSEETVLYAVSLSGQKGRF